MGVDHLLGGVILAGGGWLTWKVFQEQRDQQEREAQLYFANLNAQQQQQNTSNSGTDPLLTWGIETALNLIGNSNNTSSDRAWPGLGDLFGGSTGSNSGASAGGSGGAQAGGSSGSTWLAGLGDALGGFFGSTGSASGASAGGSGGAVAGAQGSVNVSGLLNLIGGLEAPQGYDQVYGGSVIQPPQPITTMTVSQVLAWQDRSVAAGSASSAAGRYQIIRSTLRGLVSDGTLRSGEYFDREAQDRAGVALLNRRGLSRYQAGTMSAERFANNLAKEWASLPVVSGSRAGQSYYAGDGLNHALTTPGTVMNALGAWV